MGRRRGITLRRSVALLRAVALLRLGIALLRLRVALLRLRVALRWSVALGLRIALLLRRGGALLLRPGRWWRAERRLADGRNGAAVGRSAGQAGGLRAE